jgi:hypothetical protein
MFSAAVAAGTLIGGTIRRSFWEEYIIWISILELPLYFAFALR